MILEVRGAQVQAGGQPVLKDLDLSVTDGEWIALVGPNGAGKSTLLRACLGLVPLAAGQITLGGQDVHSLAPRERAGRVAWLPQVAPLTEALPTEEWVAAARFRFGESHRRAIAAAHRALTRVQATHLRHRPITELSGGEQQRAALAGLLAQEAPLLLLDEPTNHLDPRQTGEILGLLQQLWREGTTIVHVTHELGPWLRGRAAAAIRVVGLECGRVALDLPLDSTELTSALSDLYATPMRTVDHGGLRAIVPWSSPPAEREDAT